MTVKLILQNLRDRQYKKALQQSATKCNTEMQRRETVCGFGIRSKEFEKLSEIPNYQTGENRITTGYVDDYAININIWR